jgi:hypothetical protein
MADKSTFTQDEWSNILESVMMAGLAVSAAEPSGLWGAMKETFASGTALARMKMDASANPLIAAVIADFETSEGRRITREGLSQKLKGLKPDQMKAVCIETLRQAAATVDAKAPTEAKAFKGWLGQISQDVAEAAKEGGGIFGGGVAVSENEKATLAEISAALRLV